MPDLQFCQCQLRLMNQHVCFWPLFVLRTEPCFYFGSLLFELHFDGRMVDLLELQCFLKNEIKKNR